MTARSLVQVAAAVILDGAGGVLLAQRPSGKAYAGYWEFPGGKLEPGETPRAALERELREELGITVLRAAPWLVQRFVYPHAHVELHFFRVFAFAGAPVGHDGQAFAWQRIGRIEVAPLLPANAPVLRALVLPPIYGITVADDIGEARFLPRARRAIERGLRLVQVRAKAWPRERQRRLVDALLGIAEGTGTRVLLNGSEDDARSWGCHGVHWTSARLHEAVSRPRGLLCGASCHTPADIGRAGALELDFAVMGPVLSTPSHPGAPGLGWDGLQAGIVATTVPVFALGGLDMGMLPMAMDRGAHGIAMRRGAWPE